MKHWFIVLGLAGLYGCEGEPSAPDPGALKFDAACKDCHGERGEGRSFYSTLAGRPASELVARLKLYRTGHKTDGMSETMRPFAQMLNEQEIEQIAAWLARQ